MWHQSCDSDIVYTKLFLRHGPSGPLSSVMTNRFGFQLVVMTGGLLISLGTIATSFANSINQMYITYGLIAGIELLSSSFEHHRISCLAAYLAELQFKNSHLVHCAGMGYCLTFLPTVSILSQYFTRRRSLVTAVASTGESLSMFALAPGECKRSPDVLCIHLEQTRLSFTLLLS